MGEALNPEAPAAVAGDTALPGMPTMEQLEQQLQDRVAGLRTKIAEKVAARKTLQQEVNEARVELARVERLLKATKPRGSR